MPNRVRRIPAAAVLAAVVALLATACSSTSGQASPTVTVTAPGGSGSTQSGTAAAPASSTSSSAAPTKPVHIKLLNSDGSEYGVGMPVIAFFSRKITSGKALQDATTATVNGKPITGAWYFEYSSYYKGYPIEGHWRPQTYWPAHATIHVAIPAKNLSAGRGLSYDDSLTSDFTTGPRNISSVNDVTHRMTVTTDGRKYGTFPVSLGARNTPTAHGIKVIMEKGRSICMRGPGYYECGVKYTQRLTYGGEYLHSAPWNVSNIEHGVDSSNGCTNLLPADAERLYRFLRVGDVVEYPNANGPQMQLGSGYGDWNVSWGAWQTGGLVSTTT
ncbi:MAG TPA: L,D-transpeptidase [Jatrophihabitans sp.]|jgi:lipoprotein-anchoring transpeptidase ErfK/SrfK|nr:L,D-transpeptidase [Jatrophihabitans sp.]